jgi:hypothetical protein
MASTPRSMVNNTYLWAACSSCHRCLCMHSVAPAEGVLLACPAAPPSPSAAIQQPSFGLAASPPHHPIPASLSCARLCTNAAQTPGTLLSSLANPTARFPGKQFTVCTGKQPQQLPHTLYTLHKSCHARGSLHVQDNSQSSCCKHHFANASRCSLHLSLSHARARAQRHRPAMRACLRMIGTPRLHTGGSHCMAWHT